MHIFVVTLDLLSLVLYYSVHCCSTMEGSTIMVHVAGLACKLVQHAEGLHNSASFLC